MSWISDWINWVKNQWGTQPAPTPQPAPPPTPISVLIQQLLSAHNAERSRQGLVLLRLNDALTRAASKHCVWMAQSGVLSHTGAGGSSMAQRIDAEGYHWRALGENIASGQRTAQQAMAAWMSSAGHRANILGSFLDVGFGISNASGIMFWCSDFGTNTSSNGNAITTVSLPGPLKS